MTVSTCFAQRLHLITIILLFVSSAGRAQNHVDLFPFISPVPGSSLVSPGNNIIIRFSEDFDRSVPSPDLLQVSGSLSGAHDGKMVFSSDGALIFQPLEPFRPGERVKVTLADGMRTTGGTSVPALEFSFRISDTPPGINRRCLDEYLSWTALPVPAADHGTRVLCDTLPAGYPSVELLLRDNPDPGFLFVSPFPGGGAAGHLMILDNDAVPIFYRKMPAPVLDFKKQPNGLLTYYDFRVDRKYFVMDSAYTVVDSIRSGNGYPMTDGHELLLEEDGNAILMIYDIQTIRMDTVVAGGDSAAQVVGLVLQELDSDRNVIFQWRSWDHFSIFDGAVSGYVVLDSSWIDYVHGNSIEVDSDGNWIVSNRHMNEITKIDRQTGEIIWRMGLNAANNDFTFINDTRGFSHQHDVRRLPNGNLTMFDNGNFLNPEYSRAVEYALDEQNMTATLVWEYRDSPDVFGAFMGSARRSPGTGSTLINWGGTVVAPSVTEVHSDGTKGIELNFVGNSFSYRAYRFDWQTNMFTTGTDSLDFGVVAPGDSSLRALNLGNNSGTGVTITCLTNADPAFAAHADLPIYIPPFSSVGLTVRFVPPADGDFIDYLYVRTVSDTTLVARRIVLAGTTIVAGVDSETGQPTVFSLEQNYPNPFNPTTTFSFSIPHSSFISFTVYDLLGREIATLVNEKRAAGTYTEQWDAAGLPSGVYLYRLRAGGYVDTKKLVLVK